MKSSLNQLTFSKVLVLPTPSRVPLTLSVLPCHGPFLIAQLCEAQWLSGPALAGLGSVTIISYQYPP